jgi:hypothetical protein
MMMMMKSTTAAAPPYLCPQKISNEKVMQNTAYEAGVSMTKESHSRRKESVKLLTVKIGKKNLCL